MNSKSTQNSKNTVGRITNLLRDGFDAWRSRSIWTALFVCAGLFLILLSLLTLFESGLYLSSALKTTVVTAGLLISIAAGFVLFISRSKASFREFYEMFFEYSGHREIHSAVDLYLNDDQKSSRFYHTAIQSNISGYREHEFKERLASFLSDSTAYKHFKKSLLLLTAGVVCMVAAGFHSPDGTQRLTRFWSEFERPNPYSFTVVPGDSTIEHGSGVQPGILFTGNQIPDDIYLSFKTDVETEYRSRPLRSEPSSSGVLFLADELELTTELSYRIEMGEFLSDTYQILVEMQPRFDRLIAVITPPSYTGLQKSEYEYPFSGLSFYPGSRLDLEGTANKLLQSAEISYDDDWNPLNTEQPTVDSEPVTYRYSMNPVSDDTLVFRLIDDDGLSNRNPFRTTLTVRDDQYPEAAILEPTGTVMMPDPSEIMVFYQATDDFSLSRAELRWELSRAFVDEPLTGSMSLDRPSNGRTESFSWNLPELDLRPRDDLEFRIRVWDNDDFSGYKWSESQTVTIRIPSLADYFEELDSKERDVQGELSELDENFSQMEQEYRELLEKLRQNPDGGFEEQQAMEEIRKRQQQVEESVREMNSRFREMRSEIQQSDRVSDETRQAYRELQQLIEELDDPALREAMEQMQQALENMSPQEIERALENMDFNEKLYRERLQRTAELFKRLKMNSDLDKLAAQFEDLAERITPDDDQSLNRLQEELQTMDEDLNSVSNQLEQLDSDPPRRSAETLKKLKEESQEGLNSIREDLEQLGDDASRQLEEEGGNEAPDEAIQNQQQQISESLKREAGKFRSSIQQMGGQQLQVNILALQQALYTLLELSDTQEYITQTASDTRSRSQGFVELGRNQKNVSDQFTKVSDTLFNVSAQLPGVPNRINQKKAEVERILNRTLNEMVERNQRGSAVTSREALGGINDLTSMLANLIDQLMNMQGNGGGGGGGMSMEQMIEQMQQMSGDQMQLNQQLDQMINDIQGDRLSREQAERLDQMARQQNEIRRQLQEMQQRGALEPGDRAMSELERMIEEMEESINEMRGGITDPLMVQRQQNILSRMLETEESLQQRGESEEREGTASGRYDRTLPPDITLEELEQEIRSRLQDPNYTRFSEQYRRLIERYFELLRRQERR